MGADGVGAVPWSLGAVGGEMTTGRMGIHWGSALWLAEKPKENEGRRKTEETGCVEARETSRKSLSLSSRDQGLRQQHLETACCSVTFVIFMRIKGQSCVFQVDPGLRVQQPSFTSLSHGRENYPSLLPPPSFYSIFPGQVTIGEITNFHSMLK